MPVVSVSMPSELIDQLDEIVEARDYTGRSEVVREGARSLLTEFEDDRLEERRLAAVVAIFYDFGIADVEHQVTNLRHEYESLVVSNDHSHVGDDPDAYCLDCVTLEGKLDQISAFVGNCRAIDGVETVEYSLLPVDAIGQLL